MKAPKRKPNTTEDGQLACAYGEPWMGEHPLCEAAHAPLFHLEVNEAQCFELSVGRIPGEVQEMARALCDWTQEDLRKNAAKPVRKKAR